MAAAVAPPGAPSHGRVLRRGMAMLWALVRLSPGTFTVAVAGAAVFALATVASSMAVRWITDRVIVPRFDDGSVATGTVVAGCAFVILVGVVKSIGVVTRRSLAAVTRSNAQAALQASVLDHYQRQPLAWHQAHPTGDLVAHAGVDVEAATDIINPVPYSTGVVLLVVVAAIWLLLTDVVLGAIAVALFPVLVAVNVLYQHRVSPPAELAQAHLGDVSRLVHESVDGAMVVKALGAADHEVARLDVRASALRDAKIRVATLRATF